MLVCKIFILIFQCQREFYNTIMSFKEGELMLHDKKVLNFTRLE